LQGKNADPGLRPAGTIVGDPRLAAVAGVAHIPASELADFITGSVYPVDGVHAVHGHEEEDPWARHATSR
jgi:hypothetical protein